MGALDLMAGWPVGRSAGAVLRRGRDGVELVATRGEPTAPFAWASVTKLASALAVLVAVEEGSIALEDPVGPPGSSLAHLLAHASGLGPEGQVLAPPATRRIYTNAGYVEAARSLEERTAVPFQHYLAESVLGPLAMTGARLEPPGPDGAGAGLAGGLADLVALAGELVAPGRVVHRSTLAVASSVAFGGLAGVLPGFGRAEPNDWGTGPEIRGHKAPHWTGTTNSPQTFGHFGQAGGFLWVDPAHGLACAVLTDRPFGAWARALWPALGDAVVAEHGAVDGPVAPSRQ